MTLFAWLLTYLIHSTVHRDHPGAAAGFSARGGDVARGCTGDIN